ncbi:helix-turn-helix transcriptional regulator [Roseateles sp.]|uniref:helix-turn-helix domain-containing protein n=1 Tax=Roseateles sp. TaxID=1971397 RepID=UPI002E02A040|nr:helix-turn-helix transcriptional regulator [Roseateles sp.]
MPPKRDQTEPLDPRLVFGRQLATLRKQVGLSQEALALESGLARSYLGGVERGQRNIALLNICRLAVALSVPPSKLLETL